MSMLSAQCDELRAMAESVGLAMPQAATLMMEAADTIWELRNKCADLMDEREEYVWTREFMDRMAKHCGTKDCPSLVAYVEGLEDENAKLRELVRNLLRVIPRDVSGVVIGAHGEHPTYYSFADAMRELGVGE